MLMCGLIVVGQGGMQAVALAQVVAQHGIDQTPESTAGDLASGGDRLIDHHVSGVGPRLQAIERPQQQRLDLRMRQGLFQQVAQNELAAGVTAQGPVGHILPQPARAAPGAVLRPVSACVRTSSRAAPRRRSRVPPITGSERAESGGSWQGVTAAARERRCFARCVPVYARVAHGDDGKVGVDDKACDPLVSKGWASLARRPVMARPSLSNDNAHMDSSSLKPCARLSVTAAFGNDSAEGGCLVLSQGLSDAEEIERESMHRCSSRTARNPSRDDIDLDR
jgi:hypothetical protein